MGKSDFCGAPVQQLVRFGMLVALGHSQAAHLHATGALNAGATGADLFGVCETGGGETGGRVRRLAAENGGSCWSPPAGALGRQLSATRLTASLPEATNGADACDACPIRRLEFS